MSDWKRLERESSYWQLDLGHHKYDMCMIVGPYPNDLYLFASGVVDVTYYIGDPTDESNLEEIAGVFGYEVSELQSDEGLVASCIFKYNLIDFLKKEFTTIHKAHGMVHEYIRRFFEQKVNTYRALGYRIVEFEATEEDYGTSSWIAAFDTHGVNADELPIEAFANKFWMEDLRDYASYSGPVSEVQHWDVTDDMGEMDGYDCTGDFPVMQLVDL